MRYLVISDIHSNLAALDAVLEDAPSGLAVWCLGDIVGYGPNPNECIERLRSLNPECIVGNHDWAVLGRASLEDFNMEARMAVRWTQEQLTSENLAYLEDLPVSLVRGRFTLVNGSPRAPIWDTHSAKPASPRCPGSPTGAHGDRRSVQRVRPYPP